MPPKKRKPAASKRRASPRRSPPEVFIPAAFVAPVVEAAPVEAEEAGVYVPPSFADERAGRVPLDTQAGLDFEVLREYAAERTRSGFDERGACRYGCDGMLSIIGRVRPPVAMHDWFCPYWDTPEGIKDMKALERQRD